MKIVLINLRSCNKLIIFPAGSRSSQAPVPVARQSQPFPQTVDNIESLVQHYLSNPEELTSLQQTNPELAQALISGDYNSIGQAMARYRQQIMVCLIYSTACNRSP